MKFPNDWLSLIVVSILTILTACGETPEQQLKTQESKVHTLSPEQLNIANANAKAYFEQLWPFSDSNSDRKEAKGKLLNCRPTDSNFNNLVSCTGYVVDTNGVLQPATIYSRYVGQGTSDQDTVK